MKKIWNHVAEISGKAAAFLAALLWPEICPFCGKASRQGICPACRKAVDRLVIREPRCMQCGRPVRSPEQEYCRDCMEVRRSFDQGVSLWLHKKPVPWSVYQFKYHNQRRFSHFYAEEMSKGFGRQIARWKPDLIVPVPLHKKRLRKRGFNQAALLAEDLSRRLGIPADKEALVRTRDTTAQKRWEGRTGEEISPVHLPFQKTSGRSGPYSSSTISTPPEIPWMRLQKHSGRQAFKKSTF